MNFLNEIKFIDNCLVETTRISRRELVGRDDITWTGPDGETLTNDEMLELVGEDAESWSQPEEISFYGTEEEFENYIKGLRQEQND